jgi:small nuclear ribonucleoprotein F
MSECTVVSPAALLKSLYGRQIALKSKWGQQYVGTLISCDSYMNLQLAETEEQSAKDTTTLGDVLFRCNNILYIREVPAGQDLRKQQQ